MNAELCVVSGRELPHLYSHVGFTSPPSALYDSLEQRHEEKILAVFVHQWFQPSVCSQIPSIKDFWSMMSCAGSLSTCSQCRVSTMYKQIMNDLTAASATDWFTFRVETPAHPKVGSSIDIYIGASLSVLPQRFHAHSSFLGTCTDDWFLNLFRCLFFSYCITHTVFIICGHDFFYYE